MTEWYTEPTMNDTGGIFEMFRYVNNVADGLFFPVILGVIWFIIFITLLGSGNMQRSSVSKAWIFSSFLCSVLAIILSIMDLVAPKWMYALFVMTGFGALWAILEQSKE